MKERWREVDRQTEDRWIDGRADRQNTEWKPQCCRLPGGESKTFVLTLFSNNCNSQERCVFFRLVEEAPSGPPSPPFSSGWRKASWFSDGGGAVGPGG